MIWGTPILGNLHILGHASNKPILKPIQLVKLVSKAERLHGHVLQNGQRGAPQSGTLAAADGCIVTDLVHLTTWVWINTY